MKRASICLEIINRTTNDLNIHMSEEVNIKYCKSFPVAHKFFMK